MLRLKIINNPKPLRLRTQVNFPNVILGKMQEKTVKPKTTFQEILPDKNYDGLSKVNVEAVTNEIDENIKSENIKKDVSILGVQGNVEELKGTKLEITKNGTYTPEDPYNAYTEVVANIEPDVSEYFGTTISEPGSSSYSGVQRLITKMPSFTLTTKNAAYLFAYYFNLLNIPYIDTSNVTNASNMFQYCTTIKTIPQLDISNATSLSYMFYQCNKLETIPQLDTSNVKFFSNTFGACWVLQSVPKLNASKAISISDMFSNCNNLTTFGGLENLGQGYATSVSANYTNYKLNLSYSVKLTHDSLMNVGNNLYDIASKGCKTQQVIIGSTNMGKLTPEELLVFTNKGFSVS